MKLIHERSEEIPLSVACGAAGFPRASLYRTLRPRPALLSSRRGRTPPRKLTEAERSTLLALLHSPEFCDQPPAEVFAKLLSRGEYHGSIRTMYRVLASRNESFERRKQRAVQRHSKPIIVARAPNQVWTWDITRLCGPEKGSFFYLYVVQDLYSRFVVGWMVAERESANLATQLMSETIIRSDIKPGQLTTHSDRGSPMTSKEMSQLLADLGVGKSLSRPRVSNDNPFIESHFRTLKYQPDYPKRFSSKNEARTWLAEFFCWYNHQHHHDGLALFTPADVYLCRTLEIAKQRQEILNEAFSSHPERFVKGQPKVKLPPSEVHINREVESIGSVSETHTAPLPLLEGLQRSQGQSRAAMAGARSVRTLDGPENAHISPPGQWPQAAQAPIKEEILR